MFSRENSHAFFNQGIYQKMSNNKRKHQAEILTTIYPS